MKSKSNLLVLEVKNVSKKYFLGKNEVNALDGISFDVKEGELISIMGPSGSGKTTLLNLIGALDTPTTGKIIINYKDLSKMNDSQLTKLRLRDVGFVFQFYNLIPVLSAYENVELPLIALGIKKKERKKRIEDIFEKLDLLDRMRHKPEELSGGQQQRVAIARALINKPSIILGDELTGDLDTKTGNEIMKYIKELNKNENQTFIIVTHDTEIAKQTEKILHIKDGRIEKIVEK
ncbi:MAG: ABC transporter ATP-binding protein [Candidatus Helarchaeota archaeon]